MKPSAFGNFRSTVTSKRTPSQPKVNPLPYLVEFESREQRRPRKRQIYVEAAVDGPHFVYTGKKLTAQMKFFTYIPLGKFCSEECTFFNGVSKQSRMEVSCVSSDSVVWLSSGTLGHPAKYVFSTSV